MSTNHQPTNCEQCGRPLATDDHGKPRYRCVIKLRHAQPPLSIKCCHACWEVAAGRRETVPVAQHA